MTPAATVLAERYARTVASTIAVVRSFARRKSSDRFPSCIVISATRLNTMRGDGVAVHGPDSLRSALADRPAQPVKVVLIRGGQRQELDVTLAATT